MRTQINFIGIAGNLTKDPELRHLPSGSPLCDIFIAANKDHKNKDGEKKELTVFVQVVAWGKLAEICAEYLSKGDCIFVQGELRYQAWETDEGDKRSKIFIKADRIQFLETSKKSREAGEAQPAIPGSDARQENPTSTDDSAEPFDANEVLPF